MLQVFRNRGLTSVVYGVIIIGMSLVFVIQFNPSAGKKTASLEEQCAARVKGHCITPKDHLAAYRILIPRGQQQEPLTAKAKQMGLLRTSLDGLVERELLVSDAERLQLQVTEDEVTEEMFNGFIHVSVPSDNIGLSFSLNHVFDGKIYAGFRDPKTKHFEVKVYERSIKALMGRSPTEFREEQTRELLAAKVRDLVRARIRVSEPEAEGSYIDEKSTATLSTITVKQAYVAHYLPHPTDKEADAWGKDAANAKMVDGAVEANKAPHVRHILVKFETTATDAEKQASKDKALAALARVQHGESFATVAKEVSQDPGSAVKGGDLGTDKTDGFVAPFKEAADKLKPGEMTSELVESQFGYHIIKRDAQRTDDEIRHEVATELLTSSKVAEATKAMATKLQADIKGGMDPQKAIDAAIATLPVPPAAPKPKAAPAPPKPAAKPAAPAASASGSAAAAPAPPVVTPDRPDNDPMRPQIVTSSPFNRGGDPLPSLTPENNAKLIKFAFSAKDGDGFDQILQTDEGFVLASLKEHKTATKEEFTKEKDAYMQTLIARKQAEALAMYVKRLREDAKSKSEIKVDEKYLAEKMGGGAKPVTDGGAPAPPAEDEEDEGP